MSTLKSLDTVKMEPITRLELIKYAGASGDFNPIHLIDDEARNTGLPGIIAHGMLSMSKVSVLFSPYLEKGFIKEFSTRFTGMVLLGDVLTIVPQFEKQDGIDYHYSIEVKNQADKPVLNCKLTFSTFE